MLLAVAVMQWNITKYQVNIVCPNGYQCKSIYKTERFDNCVEAAKRIRILLKKQR